MCDSGYPTVPRLYPRPIQISGTFPSPILVLVLVSTMAASLKEAGPTCSVWSLTFNKCDHLKETKSSTILYNKYISISPAGSQKCLKRFTKLLSYDPTSKFGFIWLKQKIKIRKI